MKNLYEAGLEIFNEMKKTAARKKGRKSGEEIQDIGYRYIRGLSCEALEEYKKAFSDAIYSLIDWLYTLALVNYDDTDPEYIESEKRKNESLEALEKSLEENKGTLEKFSEHPKHSLGFWG